MNSLKNRDYEWDDALGGPCKRTFIQSDAKSAHHAKEPEKPPCVALNTLQLLCILYVVIYISRI